MSDGLAGARIALVHDWLTGMRGGERVLEVLCEQFPDASLHTLLHVPGSVSPTIERHRPQTSFLQQVPGVARLYRHLLPLYPRAIEGLDVGDADLVISTSHCAAKSVPTHPPTRHLCYCFTPVRYAWDQFDQYFGVERVGRVRAAVMRHLLDRFARWDQRTSGRPDRYVAISQYVARRIRRYYNRRSAVVYPPVDTTYFTPGESRREGYALVVSALVPYKRVDVAVAACRQLGVPLRIVGQGPEFGALSRMGGTGVTFLGALPDAEVRDLYRRAAVVLLPGEEDFGLVPVEAQACGTPVVAFGRGGATETIVDGQTGALTGEGVDALAGGIRRVLDRPPAPAACRAQAERFATERFVKELTDAVTDLRQAAPEAVRW
ncbi:glycosyl transferase family 1 [Luteitalea sp. TBR-22]|uniref:glycosyltransferase n=1 Tax=Luteitalea sp. TBR-22 TaxID=2802971 RepID=UPI001AF770EE|nr:glycosyltransferase [Luteitalea sp. TBR-22]BCS33698.1 glycosyl transferase family 1 [Luteitalea sp. TBR-22]